MLATYANSFASFCVALFALGVAAGLYLPSGLSTIFSTIPQSFLARGIAIHELAPNLGCLMAPLLWQAVSGFLTWRQCLFGVGVSLILAGLLYRFSKFPIKSKGVRPELGLVRQLFVDSSFWLLVLLFSFAICSALGLYAMLPLFLVSTHGMEIDEANYIVAASRILCLLTPFLGGWLGDRFGNMKVMAAMLIATGLITVMVGVSSGKTLILLLTLQAMVSVAFFPSGLAVLSSFSVAGKANVAVSFCIPFAFVIGAGVLPLLIGAIGDQTSIATGIGVTGVAIFIVGLVALFALRSPVEGSA